MNATRQSHQAKLVELTFLLAIPGILVSQVKPGGLDVHAERIPIHSPLLRKYCLELAHVLDSRKAQADTADTDTDTDGHTQRRKRRNKQVKSKKNDLNESEIVFLKAKHVFFVNRASLGVCNPEFRKRLSNTKRRIIKNK